MPDKGSIQRHFRSEFFQWGVEKLKELPPEIAKHISYFTDNYYILFLEETLVKERSDAG